VLSITTELRTLRSMEHPLVLAMTDARWVSPTRLRALLPREMTLLILRATPTPTRRVPARLVLPRGERALSLRRGASDDGRAPGEWGRRLEVPGHLRHKPAARRIGLRKLVLLRRGQMP